MTDFAAQPCAIVLSQGSKVLLLEPNVMVENVSEEVTGTEGR